MERIEEYFWNIGYRIDDSGKVFNPKGKEIKGSVNNGYFCSKFKNIGTNINFHRLQAYRKYGDKIYEKNVHVTHKDNNSRNNSWENILIGSPTDNRFDMPEEKRLYYGRYAAKFVRKLSDEKYIEFMKDRENGYSYRELMKKYNLAKSTVSYICTGKTYRT
jgi:hypothetical protein